MTPLADLYDQAARINIGLTILPFCDDKLRVVVTGSRGWTHGPSVAAVLSGLSATHGPLHVTHGGARGLDAIAGTVVEVMLWIGWTVHCEPCTAGEWQRYGKRAGNLRNERMVDMGQDVCVGFPLPGSRGTWNCMDYAWRKKVPTFVVERPLERGKDWAIRSFTKDDHDRLRNR